MSERVKVEMVYMGRRQLSSGGLAYRWARPGEEEQAGVWGKLKGHAIGHLYEVTVVPPAEGMSITSVYNHPAPAYIGKKWDGDAAEVAMWQAADLAAVDANRLRLVEARQKKSPELEAALVSLLPLVKKCRSYSDIQALTLTVQRKLFDEWHRP